MLVYHHNNLDGRCAAAIIRRAWDCGILKRSKEQKLLCPAGNRIDFREINYNDNPDFSAEVNPDEIVFVVDFSFKLEKMAELVIIAGKIVWIDHHKTAQVYEGQKLPGIDEYYSFDGVRDFTEPGKAGCELMWEYLFPDETVPEAVRMLGDYDTWRFDTKKESTAFQFGLRAMSNHPDALIWCELLVNAGYKQIIDSGTAIINYKTNVSRRILESGYNVGFEGCFCFVVNTPMIDSAMFDLHACGGEYDFFISWVYTGEEYVVSMRSRNNTDVSKIAKKHGGGGHKGAAGFVCEALPF